MTSHSSSAASYKPYHELQKQFHDVALLESTSSLLSWDQETYMPQGGVSHRADQLAYLGGVAHKLKTEEKVGAWLSACEDKGLNGETVAGANVREWRHAYDRAVKLPVHFVAEFEQKASLSRSVWVEARKRSDFSHYESSLTGILDLVRRKTDYLGYDQSPYDALLDQYERGLRADDLNRLFAELRPAIVALTPGAINSTASVPEDFLHGNYPVSGQQSLNREIATAMGFEFREGRIDTTTHPFCTGLGPSDHRLTTRYDETDFSVSLYGVLHEVGHGLYEQGLDTAFYGMPMGQSVSLGIHESQSRLWENKVGRSPDFWQHWHPIACRHLPQLKRFTPEEITAAVNRVSPSFIRVEADELFYDLHIILRFELEKALVEDRLKVKDLPARWNEEFNAMIGLDVPNDALGCLQDIHWSMGDLGYFPTYTLGNLNAAQLFTRAQQSLPGLTTLLGQGEYQLLLNWLRSNVHIHGSRYLPQDLMRRATGEETSARHHLEYLRHKFCGLKENY